MLRSPTHTDDILRLVHAQGVQRPFEILRRMPERSRLLLGRLLGCALREGDAAEAQAWRLINQNLRGLQARTHRLPETLSPFARNNNWWEIVTRTARRLGLRFDPGMKDEEVERLLFDRLAHQFAARCLRDGVEPETFLAELHPTLSRAIASLDLSPDGTRALLGGLLHSADGGDAREGANRVTDWLRRALPWSWTTSISTGLRVLQQRLCDVYEDWVTQSPWRASNYGKVGTALAVIYLHAVVDRTREQFDLVGS